MNDELKRSIEEIEKTEEIFEPDIFGLEHITDFDSYDARLKEALEIYDDVCKTFRGTDPNKRKIMKAAESVEIIAKMLIARVSVIFHMTDATLEKRQEGRDILDRICKDADIRERTCNQYYKAVKDKYPEQTEYVDGLRIEAVDRMNFLNRCMSTQNHYLNDGIKRNDYGQARRRIRKEMLRSRGTHPLPCAGRPYVPASAHLPARSGAGRTAGPDTAGAIPESSGAGRGLQRV